MSSFLGPALRAIVMGRQGMLQGQQRTAEMESAAKLQAIQMAMKEAAARREEADRIEASKHRAAVLAETMRHNQAVESKPVNTPAPRIDPLSPEGIEATVKREKALKGIPTYGQAHPKTPSGGGSGDAKDSGSKGAPKTTEGEKKAAALYGIAAGDASALDNMKASLPQRIASKVPLIGNMALGAFDKEYQQQRAAGERFVDQWLRFTSGAQISETERENAMRLFVPEPGDAPEKIADKKKARDNALEGLRRAGGNALNAEPVDEGGFAAESAMLNRQAEAAIAAGKDPVLVQIRLEKELEKLRRKYK